jgi:hypothetical protein
MLVKDPAFSGHKENCLSYSIPPKNGISASLQQIFRNQNPVSLHYLHHSILKRDSDFKILVFMDSSLHYQHHILVYFLLCYTGYGIFTLQNLFELI